MHLLLDVTLSALLVLLGFIIYNSLVAERFQFVEGKPFKFETCVATLHQEVAKYNPLVSGRHDLGSPDEEDGDGDHRPPPEDRDQLEEVMGGALQRPQGRKAAKAEAALKRQSRKTNDDEGGETEAAAASRIADSFQSLASSMVVVQEFDRLERAIKLLREQGRFELAEKKTDELLAQMDAPSLCRAARPTAFLIETPVATRPPSLSPPTMLPTAPSTSTPSSPDDDGG
jgi:hypothetical protein